MLIGYLLITVVIFIICLSNRVGFLHSLGWSVFWPAVVACSPLVLISLVCMPVLAIAEKMTGLQFFFGYGTVLVIACLMPW